MQLKTHLRNTFLAGIFAATPLAVTIFVIWYIEAVTRQPLRDLLNINIPFLGIVLALLLIYLLGLVVSSLVGRWILSLVDRLLQRVPLLRDVYHAWKQVSLTPGGREGIFAKVVLVPAEGGQMRTLGFTSGEAIEGDKRMCCVFVPAAPNPTSGRIYFIPRCDCQVIDLSVEDAFKMILSGGNFVPREIGAVTGSESGTRPPIGG